MADDRAGQEPLKPATIAPSGFTPLSEAGPEKPRQRKPLRALLLVTLTAFALVLLFLFSARSLQVQVTATAPADVDIDGFALPFGDRYLLLPGEYGLHVKAPGYHPLQQQVTVDDLSLIHISEPTRPTT